MAEQATEAATTTTVAATASDAGTKELTQFLDSPDAGATTAPAKETTADAGETKATDQAGKSEATNKSTTDTPTLTAKQIEACKQLGMSDEEIAELTPETAKPYVDGGTRVRKAMLKFQRRQDKLKETATAGAETDKGEKEATDSGEVLPLPKFEPLTPDDLDDRDKLLAKLNGALEAGYKANQEFHRKLTSQESQAREVQVQQYVREADTFFGELDAKVFDQFGIGKTEELDERSDDFAERSAVMHLARDIQRGLARQDRDVEYNKCLETAVSQLYPDQAQEAARIAAEALAKAKPRGAARPGGATATVKAMDPDKASTEAFTEFLEKRG